MNPVEEIKRELTIVDKIDPPCPTCGCRPRGEYRSRLRDFYQEYNNEIVNQALEQLADEAIVLAKLNAAIIQQGTYPPK